MTDEELCKNLRALSPGYSKMDGSYIEIGLQAADEIERLNLELRNERDVRAEAERGCASMAKEIKRLVAENKELRAAADRSANDDKPIGFRTWDVPNPYAEGPQNEVYDKIKGHAVTQPDAEPNSLQNTIAEILRAEFDEAGPDDMVTYLKIQSQLIAGAIVRQIYTAPPRPAQSDALMAARDEIISLLPQDWFENGFLKEPHPVIDKIDIALAALPRPSDRSRK